MDGNSDPHPLFVGSLNPMLVADDDRRIVAANVAACLFLRLSAEAVRGLTIDDLNPPPLRSGMAATWAEFLRSGGSRKGARMLPWDMQMPDGTTVPVDISATPHWRPGRHLAIILFPAARELNERLEHAEPPSNVVLTTREREVLTLVALGNTGTEIAAKLFVAPTTVQTHVTNALVKLGAKNRAHGIMLALKRGELMLHAGHDDAALHIESRLRSLKPSDC